MPQLLSEGGIGFCFIHPPLAYSKKSSAGLTVLYIWGASISLIGGGALSLNFLRACRATPATTATPEIFCFNFNKKLQLKIGDERGLGTTQNSAKCTSHSFKQINMNRIILRPLSNF